MKNVTLQGNPTSAADVRDTVGFPNIWATATVPTSNRVRFEPPFLISDIGLLPLGV